jgi:hypothetical protein
MGRTGLITMSRIFFAPAGLNKPEMTQASQGAPLLSATD